ncbi:MAG: hypothetical protein KGR16_03225 [Verrucomicrobia bacterium]|nr:hypothetical protein [Verrucomicrobiota bacterium]
MSSGRLGDRLSEYQVDENTYAVIVVMNGISASEAQHRARIRAAELTVMQGNRYFTVDSATQIQVMRTEGGSRFYENMYQELIQEGDFGQTRLSEEGQPVTQTFPAVRLQFTMYAERPGFGAVDACTLTRCK